MSANTMETVLQVLSDWPKSRDSDKKLIAMVLKIELRNQGKNPDLISASDFLDMYYSGKFSSAETIRRERQRIQEDMPSLRGTRRKERKDHQHFVRSRIVHSGVQDVVGKLI